MRRLSAGSAMAESVFARLGSLAGGFLRTGACDPLVEDAMPYPEVNGLMPTA